MIIQLGHYTVHISSGELILSLCFDLMMFSLITWWAYSRRHKKNIPEPPWPRDKF